MSNQKRRRIFIVGGKGKNIPHWISKAFDWEQFDQENSKTRDLEPSGKPDAVVVLSSWVGHEHFYGARDLADRFDIPLILSPGGWSSSLKSAADLGVDWFIKDIERTKGSDELTKTETEEIEDFIDNAWREAYNREWSARAALERRYAKDRVKFEAASDELEKLKSRDAAAQRVISEVRAAAAVQRAELERHSSEVQARNDQITKMLLDHISSLEEMFTTSESVYSAMAAFSTVRRIVKQKVDTLNAALSVAESTGEPTESCQAVPSNSEMSA